MTAFRLGGLPSTTASRAAQPDAVLVEVQTSLPQHAGWPNRDPAQLRRYYDRVWEACFISWQIEDTYPEGGIEVRL